MVSSEQSRLIRGDLGTHEEKKRESLLSRRYPQSKKKSSELYCDIKAFTILNCSFWCQTKIKLTLTFWKFYSFWKYDEKMGNSIQCFSFSKRSLGLKFRI
jgi:hypothetical protein